MRNSRGHPLPPSMADREATSRRGWGAPTATARLDYTGDREGVEELVGLLTTGGNEEEWPDFEVGGADGCARGDRSSW
jgi:hypothetical protein